MDYVCKVAGGESAPGDDVSRVEWVPLRELARVQSDGRDDRSGRASLCDTRANELTNPFLNSKPCATCSAATCAARWDGRSWSTSLLPPIAMHRNRAGRRRRRHRLPARGVATANRIARRGHPYQLRRYSPIPRPPSPVSASKARRSRPGNLRAHAAAGSGRRGARRSCSRPAQRFPRLAAHGAAIADLRELAHELSGKILPDGIAGRPRQCRAGPPAARYRKPAPADPAFARTLPARAS